MLVHKAQKSGGHYKIVNISYKIVKLHFVSSPTLLQAIILKLNQVDTLKCFIQCHNMYHFGKHSTKCCLT